MANQASILLVDDDPELRTILAKALSKSFHILVAENASDAIEMITDEPVDLLLTDLIMPGMDGVTLAEHAAALYPSLRVIYMTGHAYLATYSPLPPRGKLLAKPFTLSAMLSEVTAALAA
jgi:two-component system, cell cycle response regulator CpdR